MQHWTIRTTRGRVLTEWRLLLVVIAVAILATTLVTSLGLLVTATEQAGLRTAVRALPASDTQLEIDLSGITAPVTASTAAASSAVRAVLKDAGTFITTTNALTEVGPVSGLGTTQSLSFFGQLQGIRSHAVLTAGVWAGANGQPGQPTPVTLPAAAAKQFDLKLGSTFTVALDYGEKKFPVIVVGLYRADHQTSDYWSRDPLRGAGNDNHFPIPDSSLQLTSDAFGPLIVGSGGLDAAAIPVQTLNVYFTPRFGGLTVGELAPLITRLNNASDDVPAHVGYIADQVDYSGDAEVPLQQIATNLIVTRSTVVVIILLLLVLAVSALSQTARLYNDARSGERQLMQARGASRGQILALATIEYLGIGVVTAVLSPLLARASYLVIAAQPSLRSAGMPTDAGTPPLVWEIAGGVAVLFVLVLLLPLVARPGSFVEGEQKKVRQRRASGLMRSGLDIGLVIIAAIVYWQLQSYRSPVGGSASLSVDPVLVAAPAIVLLAGALLCVRLIPAASRLAERIGSRSRGAVLPLAAWEVGRRSQRATAAVLLLTLALAVGTFSQSFLATWRQSQVDQASLAVGPAVRVPVDASVADEQGARLARGATGAPQPVLRRVVTVAGAGATLLDPDTLDGAQAVVLGLTPGARAQITTGRLASEGGSTIAKLLTATQPAASGIPLGDDVRGVSATIQTGHANLAGVSTRVRAIVEDATGLLMTIELGILPLDGQQHRVSGMLDTDTSGAGPAGPLTLVGLQTFIFVGNPATYKESEPEADAGFLVKDLAVLRPAAAGSTGYTTSAVSVTGREHWNAIDVDQAGSSPTTTVPAGWQLALGVLVPTGLDNVPASYTLVGWTPVVSLPAVLSAGLVKAGSIHKGASLSLVFSGALVGIQQVGTAPLVPGSADYSQLTPATASGSTSSATSAVVVDQVGLERALAQAGQPGPMVDEWWADVPAGAAQRYLAAHPAEHGAFAPRSREILARQMQQSPLRVATQAALWLAILAAALLAAVGFAVHTAATLRSRRLEFAELRAIGLSRGKLVGLVAVESLLLAVLGIVFGIVVGALLSWLVAPLVAVSPDGTPAVPSVLVVVPVADIGLLVLALVAVCAAVVLIVARVQRSIHPADILRGAGE